MGLGEKTEEDKPPPTLPADTFGGSGRTALVLLHGSVVNRRMWHGIAEPISQLAPTIVPDLPGHGDLRGRPFRMEAAVRGVVDLVEERGPTEILLIGESLGGYVALAVAAASADRPWRVLGLVLSGCTTNPTGWVASVLRAYARVAESTLGVLGAGRLRGVVERVFRWLYPRAPHGPILEHGLALGSRTGALRELAGRDFLSGLTGREVPVQIVNGSRDLLGRWGERRFVRTLPRVSVRRFRGIGHAAALARPDEFRRVAAASVRRRLAQ